MNAHRACAVPNLDIKRTEWKNKLRRSGMFPGRAVVITWSLKGTKLFFDSYETKLHQEFLACCAFELPNICCSCSIRYDREDQSTLVSKAPLDAMAFIRMAADRGRLKPSYHDGFQRLLIYRCLFPSERRINSLLNSPILQHVLPLRPVILRFSRTILHESVRQQKLEFDSEELCRWTIANIWSFDQLEYFGR